MNEYILSEEGVATEGISNVVDFASARRKTEPLEPLFTDEERRELRALLVYMRREVPIYEAAKGRCTILRRLTEEST